MKTKILALMICAGLLITTLAGCGIKLAPETGTSPDAGGKSASEKEGADTAAGSSLEGLTTLLGTVGSISSGTITLELVQPYDVSPDGEGLGLVASGSAVYTLTGETQMITLDSSTLVILENQGYVPGRISDITSGDFLAVTHSSGTAAVVIDNGEANVISQASGVSDSNTASSSGYGDTEAVQPSPSGTLNSSGDSSSSSTSATYTVTEQDLKVRKGPGTNYDILGKLDLGEKVTGTVTNGWLKFTYNGQTGYSSADYLEAA